MFPSGFTQIRDTGFSVCVVLNETERYTEFKKLREYPKRVFFHRIDLTEDPPLQCSDHGRVVYPGKSRAPLTSQRSHQPSAQNMDEFSTQVRVNFHPEVLLVKCSEH